MDEEERMEEHEQVCRKEFGFELPQLRSMLHTHTERLEDSLHRFCSQALSSSADPSARRELGFTLITDMASSCKIASDHLAQTLISMHSAFLLHLQHQQNLTQAAALSLSVKQTLVSILSRISSDMSFVRSHREHIKLHRDILQAQKEKDLLSKELASSKASFADEKARLSDDAATLKAAVQRLELEKVVVEAEAQSRVEKEKALLEVSLREEMQLCRICLQNHRNVVILPCFHGQFCEECLEEYKKTSKCCPTCRSSIRDYIEDHHHNYLDTRPPLLCANIVHPFSPKNVDFNPHYLIGCVLPNSQD